MPCATVHEIALRVRDGQAKGGSRPRFAVFLGAGASIESGIPGTQRMMRTFREKLQERWEAEGADGEFDQWLESRPNWDKTASEYSNLFEVYEPTARGRARHIETLVANRKPSWGYVGLAQLLARGYLDTVITTNFDDLVYEACASWTEVRPRVYSHGTVSGPIRQEPERPTILKLHGDFLYSRLKNTGDELDQEDPNMSSAVRRLLDDYELIVVGYGGNDRSVMELLSTLPDDAGLYWCTYRDEELGGLAQGLLERPNGYTVRTNGFDGFMDELLYTVGFDLPDVDRAVRRQRDTIVELITESGSPHMARYLAQSEESITAEDLNQRSSENKAILERIAWLRESQEPYDRGDVESSLLIVRRYLLAHPDDPSGLVRLALLLEIGDDTEGATEALQRLTELDPSRASVLRALGTQLIKAEKTDEAIELIERAQALDPRPSMQTVMGLALLAKGQVDRAKGYFIQVLGNVEELSWAQHAVTLMALGRRGEGLEIIHSSVQKGSLSAGNLLIGRAALRRIRRLGVEGAEEAIAVLDEALDQVR